MTKFKEKLEIDLLKAMTYTEINNLLNKLNRQIDYLQNKVNQVQESPVDSVRILSIEECYDKWLECETDDEFTVWVNTQLD